MAGVGQLSQTQLQLFFLVNSYFVRPTPQGTPRPVDGDVADAAQAVAATFETASRGVIYEHPAQTPAGQRLAAELLGWLQQVGKGGGTRFERDVAEVLGAIHRAAKSSADRRGGPRDYLERVARVLEDEPKAAPPEDRTIVLP